jgi:hypothetical protein
LGDGLLADIQDSPNLPADEAARVQNAVNKFGGQAEAWAVVVIPDGAWENINPKARQFWDGESLTQSEPPAAEMSAPTVEADGEAEITLLADFESELSGAVKVVITLPDGEQVSLDLEADGGVLEYGISTTLEGLHRVMVESELDGVGFTEFEGV